MTNGKKPRENPDYQPQAAGASSYLYLGIGLVVVIALVVGGFIWMNNKSYPPVDDKVLAENASFIVGDRAAPITIDIFEDFHCEHCSEFEKQSSAAIRQNVIDGKIRARYHMLNFLDGASDSGDYSSRAAGAALCVARNDDREVFWKLHSALFERWNDDLNNQQIADLAVASGAGPTSRECIASGTLVDEARSMADASKGQLNNSTEGQVATPTVLLAGKQVENITAGTGWLDDIIAGDRPTA
ncbi:DsbA family protein [Gordonia hydrophobica]|uniref:Thioredoxin domain-containing protein n=1 Tax=Gordonia hydrophobica TaxID=40516 RepID=A0ABZ2TX73_9ACTN|nr:thioredoxin domain-containing protein [Gordonia hydrophobica]MBM7366285.1 protein-disulfide isomerase [Gordonia hydrophobica]